MKIEVSICVIIITLLGCTKKNPISSLPPEDTSWSPSISILGNKYNLVRIKWEKPPDLILRGIYLYETEKSDGDTINFYKVDTADRFDSLYFSDRGDLGLGAQYYYRLKVVYTNGMVRYSNILSVVPNPAPPGLIRSLQVGSTAELVWADGALWTCDWHGLEYKIIQIETSDGTSLSSIPAPGYPPNIYVWPLQKLIWLESLAYNGIKLLALMHSAMTPSQYFIYQIDLQNGEISDIVDLSGLIEFNFHYEMAFGTGFLWIVAMTTGHETTAAQIYKIDLKNQIIANQFEIPHPYIYGIAWDGTYLWCSNNRYEEDLENYLYKIEPNSGQIVDSIATPVANPQEMTWDGSHLWIIDQHTESICKIER